MLFVGLADELDDTDSRERVTETIAPYGMQTQYLTKDSSIGRRLFRTNELPLPAFALFDGRGNLVMKHIGSLLDKKALADLERALDRLSRKKKETS